MNGAMGFMPADRAMFAGLHARAGNDDNDHLHSWITPPAWRQQQQHSDRQVCELRRYLQDEALERLGQEEMLLLSGDSLPSGTGTFHRRHSPRHLLRRLSRLLSPPPAEQLDSLRLVLISAGNDPRSWLKPAGLHRLARKCLPLDRTQVGWLASALSIGARRTFLSTYERLRPLLDNNSKRQPEEQA